MEEKRGARTAPAPRTAPEGLPLDLRGPASIRRRLDTVEVWLGGRLRGVFDRAAMRAWLREPRDWLVADDVLFVGSPGFVGVAVRGELAVGAVSLAVLMTLRELV